jgi:dehydrogenase/reductase SDR family protein 12
MSLFESLLDRTVVFSFDRNGFRRHRRRFRAEDVDVDLTGKTCLVTGANSGIGFAAARALAERGADLRLLCRNRDRGLAAVEAIGRRHVALEEVDLSDLSSIRAFVRRFRKRRVDVLVNNAGVLPDRAITTAGGLETTLATNLVGPFLLTELLLPKLSGGRVITVSSGGMYTQKLDVKGLVPKPFDGVTAYARTKRAQVVLTEVWAERHPETAFFSMHPGWADTPAVKTSIPRFWSLTRSILRTPDEGADTIVWLAVCPELASQSGRFFFDREAQPTVVLPGTREEPGERGRLWDALVSWSGLAPTR